MSRLAAGAAALLLAAGIQVGATTTADASAECVPGASLSMSGSKATGDLQCPGSNGKDGKTDKTQWTKGGQPPLCVWVPQPDYVPLPGEPAAGEDGQWYAH